MQSISFYMQNFEWLLLVQLKYSFCLFSHVNVLNFLFVSLNAGILQPKLFSSGG